MQQIYSQCAALLKQGETWWLNVDEESLLERQNGLHRSFSLIRDQLVVIVDPEVVDIAACKPMTASEVLAAAGIEHPTNPQAKECASFLREWFGEPKRINGRDKWRVPLRPEAKAETISEQPHKPLKDKFD